MSLRERHRFRIPTRNVTALLIAFLLATAPFASDSSPYQELITQYGLEENPSPDNFIICHSHGCDGLARVHLTATQWQSVRRLFTPPASRPEEERQAIAHAIALLERLTGKIADTEGDRGGNMRGFGSIDFQLDCIDESANTTLYLTLLADQHLLRWHTLEHRATRGFVIFGWPHSTAVIRDIRNNQLWAVDSWFHDNGRQPEILPLDEWRSGWRPKGFSGF